MLCTCITRNRLASFELPPSCKSERNLGRVSKLPGEGDPTQVTFPPLPHSRPLGSLDTPQVALALTNKDGGSSIKAFEFRKSHGKIGDCEQSKHESNVLSAYISFEKKCTFRLTFVINLLVYHENNAKLLEY